MFFRCLTGQANASLVAFAISLAPLSIVTVLFRTSSFMISIVAFLALGEKIFVVEICAMVVCFGAVIVIASQTKKEGAIDDETDTEEKNVFLGALMALCAAMSFSFTAVLNRSMLVEALITGNGSRFSGYSGHQLGFAALGAVFDIGALLGATISFQADSSSFISLLSYLNVVYAFFCDQLIYKETFSLACLLAALTILGTAVSVAVYKIRQKNLEEQRKLTAVEEGHFFK